MAHRGIVLTLIQSGATASDKLHKGLLGLCESILDPKIEDVRGAIYHFFFLNLSKIFTSINCAIKKAIPEPIAILIEIKSE